MTERSAVRAAMTRLLDLAKVEWRGAWTEQAGLRLHHIEAGAGRPLVLIHGGSGGGANWFRMLTPLARHYRVLAPDLPGFGLSDPIEPHIPLGHTAADRLLDWLERNDVDDALVAGTSFGGLVALRMAQRSPRVRHLLLLDSAGLGRGVHPAVRLAAASPITGMAVRPSRSGTAQLFRRLLTSNREDFPADQQRLLVEYLYATAVAAGTAYVAATLRLFCGARGQREVLGAPELRAIDIPTALVWGARDRLLPVRHAERAANLLADGSLEVIEDAGHSPNWEKPLAVVNAIHALARRTPHPLPETPGR